MRMFSTIIFSLAALLLCRCNSAGSAYEENSGQIPISGNYTGTYNSTQFNLQLLDNGSYNLQWIASGGNGLESGKYSTDDATEINFSGSRLASDGTDSAENYTCSMTVAAPSITLTCPTSTATYTVQYTKTS